jgi:hypothetical protein
MNPVNAAFELSSVGADDLPARDMNQLVANGHLWNAALGMGMGTGMDSMGVGGGSLEAVEQWK